MIQVMAPELKAPPPAPLAPFLPIESSLKPWTQTCMIVFINVTIILFCDPNPSKWLIEIGSSPVTSLSHTLEQKSKKCPRNISSLTHTGYK